MEGRARVFFRHLVARSLTRDRDFIESENCRKITAKSDILFLSERHDLLTALDRFSGIFMGFHGLVSPLFQGRREEG